MTQWFLYASVLLGAWLLTAALRRYALAKQVVDVPNSRSSHTVPTPRGGGVAIIVAFLLALLALWSMGEIAITDLLALLPAGALVAVVGFMDDHGHIPARWRLLGHFGAAAWALYWLGGLPQFTMVGYSVDLGVVGSVLAALYLVWLLNLYNFMDGIDGIASVEAICAGLGACVVYALSGHAALIAVPLLLSLAVAGFLAWNFPPAKIFMGDAGSGFLGLTLGVLSLQAMWAAPELLWCWLILLGVFIVDATFTLARRLSRRERVYEAHRSHAYQFASRRYGRHLPVTLAVAAINLFWLLPIAVWVGVFQLDGAIGVCIAYAPLLALAVHYKAGTRE